MILGPLVLALALGPAAGEPPPPSGPGELPHWRSVPPAPSEPPKPPKVPSDGSGLITLGGVALGTGGVLGLMSIGLTVANEPRTRSGREIAAFVSPFGLGAGTVLLSLGLVVRRQFRASEAGAIPDAPRTGGGMLLGGLGLMLGGTAFAAQAGVDLSTVTCSGAGGCYATRPIGAPIQLGCGLAAVAVGSGLLIGGVRRRAAYRSWALERAKLQPVVNVGPSAAVFGLAGRF